MEEAIRTRYNTSLTILRKILLYRDIEDVWKVKTGVEKTSHHFCYTIIPLIPFQFSRVLTFRSNDRNISSVKLTKEINLSSINRDGIDFNTKIRKIGSYLSVIRYVHK